MPGPGPSWTAAVNLITLRRFINVKRRSFLILLCSRPSSAWTALGIFLHQAPEIKLDGGCHPHYITSVHQCQTPNFIYIMLQTE